MMNVHILVVDDEQDIRELLRYNLEKEGFQVSEAADGGEAIQIIRKTKPDLIILDMMMPVKTGIEVCNIIKNLEDCKHIPILFLTALQDDVNELKAFDVGADDYIKKPIKTSLILSRIKARLKNLIAENDKINHQIVFDNLIIDTEKYQVIFNNEIIDLAKKEFDLLYLLAKNEGKVFTRNQILTKVWGSDMYVGDRTIDVHIRKIRSKLNDQFINTVKGVGYKFNA